MRALLAAPSAFFYLIGAFFCGLYPLPPLGATLSIRGYGEGLWLDEPYRALAFGIFYFVLVGVVELTTPDTKAVRSEGEAEADRPGR